LLAFDEPPTAIKRSSKSILFANFSFREAGKLQAPLLCASNNATT